jgi:hypothetical protein
MTRGISDNMRARIVAVLGRYERSGESVNLKTVAKSIGVSTSVVHTVMTSEGWKRMPHEKSARLGFFWQKPKHGESSL